MHADRDRPSRPGVTLRRLFDSLGFVLCGAGAASLLAALALELDSTAARVLMALAAAFFVPGALLTLAWVRVRVGPPR